MNCPARIYEMPFRDAIPLKSPDRQGPGGVVVKLSQARRRL